MDIIPTPQPTPTPTPPPAPPVPVPPLPKETITQIITRVCKENGIEPELGIAVAYCESGLDPKSTMHNKNGSIDRGIFQWNNRVFPAITDVEAYDPEKATSFFCSAIKGGHLHGYWYLSEPCWKKRLSAEILKKYNIT